MQVKYIDGVFLISPWCHHGDVRVIAAKNGKETRGFVAHADGKSELDRAMGEARRIANRYGGLEGYTEVQTPPCKSCRGQLEKLARELIPVSPHLHRP